MMISDSLLFESPGPYTYCNCCIR